MTRKYLDLSRSAGTGETPSQMRCHAVTLTTTQVRRRKTTATSRFGLMFVERKPVTWYRLTGTRSTTLDKLLQALQDMIPSPP